MAKLEIDMDEFFDKLSEKKVTMVKADRRIRKLEERLLKKDRVIAALEKRILQLENNYAPNLQKAVHDALVRSFGNMRMIPVLGLTHNESVRSVTMEVK